MKNFWKEPKTDALFKSIFPRPKNNVDVIVRKIMVAINQEIIRSDERSFIVNVTK